MILSCNRGSESEVPPQAETDRNVVEIGQPTNPQPAVPPRLDTQDTPRETVPPVVQPSQREILLSMRTTPVIQSEDFFIGPLTGTEVDTSLAPARDAIARFFEALGTGDLETAPIAEGRRGSFVRSLSFHLEQGAVPLFVRIGAIQQEGEIRLRANVRLFGDPGRTEGEIFLIREGRSWAVDDFQSDLSLLNEPYIDPYAADAFEPSKYRWLDIGQGY